MPVSSKPDIVGPFRIDQRPHWESDPTQKEAPAKEPEATTALRELCRRLRAARPTAMSALSSDVAGDVDMSTDQQFASAMNVDEARMADQAGDLDEEDEADQPVAKRPKVEDEKGSVKAFPTKLPMEYDYHDTMYYVRDCYPEYYELVMHLLDKEKKQGVTVTGTPGIGKSVFMGYFFQRYSEMYPSATVLMASYDKGSVLTEVALARGGKVIKRESERSKRMEKMMNKHLKSAGDHNIRLRDGPPTKISKATRWVSFTSPNEAWEKKLEKDTRAFAKVFMPVWTQDELRDAAIKLGRMELLEPIGDRLLKRIGAVPDELVTGLPSPAVIDVRFGIFGGVPRVCFETNDDEFVKLVNSLQIAVEGLTIDGIYAAMKAKEVPEPVHRILHYVPLEQRAQCPQQYRLATIKVASPAIECFLVKRHDDIRENKQAEFEHVARCLPEMRTMYGYAIEAKAYRLLRSGCTVNVKSLRPRAKDAQVKDLEEAKGLQEAKDDQKPNDRQKNNESLAIVLREPVDSVEITNGFDIDRFERTQPQLVLPVSKNFPSIDAVYWSPEHNKAFLFQVTVAADHPVKAPGYMNVLKALGQWKAVQAAPATTAALVFVVPKYRVDLMRAQPIISTPPLEDASPVTYITGIGREGAVKLRNHNIQNVGALRSSIRPEVYRWQELLRKHEESAVVAGSAAEGTLEQIPQYVWGI